MSRHDKTFAPRAEKSEAQTNDNKEDEKKYEQISNQDSKISLAKTEVTQITYGPFRTRAFRKVETGSARIQLLESGPHVLILNQALNALGHKVDVNDDTFRDKTQIALINFQQKNGLTGSGIFDRETLLKMNEALENLHKMEETSSQQKESQILPASTPPDEKVQISVGVIPMNIQSNQEFFEYLDIQVFGRIVDATWDIGKNTYKNYIGKATSCTVSVSSLKKHLGITDQQWEAMYKRKTSAKPSAAELRNFVKEHLKNREKAILAEINAVKKEAAALSADKKQFIRDATSKIDYLQNRRILDLLKQLSDGEMADYKNKVSKETTDLAEIEESLKAYIETRNKNLKNQNELETVKTKLYGLEDLYDQYIKYTNISPTTNIGTIKEPVIVDNPNHIAANKSLTQAMIANGFASIEEFQTYITRYENAFETETVRIGVEMLQQYKHTLYEEGKRLNNNLFLDNLSQSIIQSGAKENYKSGAQIKSDSKKVLEHGITYTDQQEYSLGQSKINSANKSISALASQTSLVNDPDFDKKEFAKISSPADLKAFLQNYIASQNEKVDRVINNIKENPEHIYELDNLFEASYKKQHIEKGSIYDSIITAKHERLRNLKILLSICEGIFAIALIVVTWGAATPVVIAGGALSLAVSIDVAYDTIKEYKNNKEFHDVGLLSDDPSLVWVVIAIAGVALDAGSLAAVLRAAKPISAAAKAFNNAEDATKALTTLESDLLKIEGLERKVRENIVKQAKIQAQQQKILDGFVKARQLTYVTIPGLAKTGELLARAVFAIRKGIVTFDSFVAELKLAKLISETGLNPEELLLVKNAFEKARNLAKDDKLAIELEKAIADNDLAKVKNLLDETEKIKGEKLSKANNSNKSKLVEDSEEKNIQESSEILEDLKYDPREDTRFEELAREEGKNSAGDIAKAQNEAEAILQAEYEGHIQNPKRPNVKGGDPDLDFKIDGPPPYKYADVKTPVNRGDLLKQATHIGKKITFQKAGANDVIHIVDLKNIPSAERTIFMENVINGAQSPNGIIFINK
ncbi:peptidoglycan-binding domain-containing protein [Chryseobacterium arthrosphaerae]|uniref:peptidoglycan-binding domain-containing protein n=2 Tax=Chryseobacterium arthrosphaerae TaxID=651561 RepID=UPI001F4BA9B4|nr:peptidoglycan-binding domain-containing protein [Chryseobacterium arthrosphaerae]